MAAAAPGGVGWVFIATPHKLAIAVQKLAVMTCTGAALPLKLAALLRKFRGTVVAPRNSTSHLTENAITFYSELLFQ